MTALLAVIGLAAGALLPTRLLRADLVAALSTRCRLPTHAARRSSRDPLGMGSTSENGAGRLSSGAVNQDVLDVTHEQGVHHCVIMKGHMGQDVAKALAFRGIEVVNLSVPVPSLAEIEKELGGPAPKGRHAVCAIHSW